jgi:TetR/AcrR family transcriptional regulator, transcriptional repressor for nem operon
MSKGEQTRQRIVAEAACLFNRRGYHGSSLQDLMQATGLEKGGI